MATLKQILEETASKPSGAIESLKEEVSKTSPLSLGQRTAIGFQNEKAQKSYLEKAFGKGNVSKDPNTNKWNIYDEKTDTVRPVDEKGFSGGDITESIGKGIVSAVTVPSAIAGKVGALGGPAGLAITSGLAGGISGATEAGRQTIGNLIAGESLKNVDMGEVGKEALYGAIAPGVGAGTSKIVGAVAGKIAEKQAIKQAAKGVKKVAEEGAQAIKPTVAHGVSASLGMKNNELAKKLIKGEVNLAGVGVDNSEEFLKASANKIEEAITSGYGALNKQTAEKLAKAGISDITEIPLKNAPKAIKELQSSMKTAKFLTPEMKSFGSQIDELAKATKGKITYGDIKQVTSALSDIKAKSFYEGKSTDLTRRVNKVLGAFTADKNSQEAIKAINKDIVQGKNALNQLQKITRTKLSEGELTQNVPLAMKLSRLSNELRGDQLIKLEELQGKINKIPGLEKLNFFEDLKTGLVGQTLEKSQAKGLELPLLSQIPVVKDIVKGITGFATPTLKGKMMSGILKNAPEVAEQEISKTLPKLSTLGHIVGSKLGGVAPAIQGAGKAIGGVMSKSPLQVSPTQQIIKGGMRELGNKVSLPKFPSPKEQEDSIQMKLKDIHDGVKKTKEKDMIRIANMYDKYYKGLPKREMA